MRRLTKQVRKELLDQNEGYKSRTSFSARNSEYDRVYEITNGRLHITEAGKTSWSDSRYKKDWDADEEETHRFLANNRGLLKGGTD